jgi:hypothetical protein
MWPGSILGGIVAELELSSPTTMTLQHHRQTLNPQQRKQLWVVIIGIILSVQYYTIRMAQEPPQTGNASWNDDEVEAFIDYLHKERSRIGDAGNFKPAVYTAAAESIAGLRTHGVKKKLSHCKTKWASV